jgi:hypothetical protein
MAGCGDRRGILSEKGAKRGGGPRFADSVRNDGFLDGQGSARTKDWSLGE